VDEIENNVNMNNCSNEKMTNAVTRSEELSPHPDDFSTFFGSRGIGFIHNLLTNNILSSWKRENLTCSS
jgi:hypothetical protein